MEDSFRRGFLTLARHEFHRLKSLAEKGIAQVDPTNFFARSDGESNSIAILVKHMSGNLRSRWTDFLTTDGEKPNRNRDTEFEVEDSETAEHLMSDWEDCWNVLFNTLEELTPDDLTRTITIRGEEFLVYQAITRQISHYAYHVGQIVMLAKRWRSGEWQTLSIARGRSEEFRANPEKYL
ncbi:MAG: DUF1572 family protein [Candidatus Kapaibacterium sp.]